MVSRNEAARGQTPTKVCSKCRHEKPLTEFGKGQRWCRDCMRVYMRAYRKRNPVTALLQKAKARAKRKGLPFDLTQDDITIPAECPALGIPIRVGTGVADDNSPTLDRIVPERGYVRGNVMVLSAKANRMKSNATSEELLRLGCFYGQNYPGVHDE